MSKPNPEREQPPAGNVSSGTLRARLKAETAHLHAQIEAVVPLLRPSLTGEGYRTYLARLLGYQKPLETALALFRVEWRDHGVDFDERRKSGLLVRDLMALGFTAAELAGLPECVALPSLCSFAEAWGCLYVLEGSTLGSQLVLRTLGPRLKLSPREGLTFLRGYAEQTGAKWKEFTDALSHFDASGGDGLAVVRGACETFVTQMAWLKGCCA